MTKTMYSRPTPREASALCDGGEASALCDSGEASALCEGGGRNKVDSVCAAVRGALVSMETDKYLLSVITTHVREMTPNLEAVLAILKELKGL